MNWRNISWNALNDRRKQTRFLKISVDEKVNMLRSLKALERYKQRLNVERGALSNENKEKIIPQYYRKAFSDERDITHIASAEEGW